MRFKEAKLTKEDWDSCIDEKGILNMDKYAKIEHQRALEQGLTNIKDLEEYRNFKRTLGRPWM